MLDIKNFYELLNEEKIIFSYKGMLDGDLIDNIMRMVDKRLKNIKVAKSIRKKVVNVLVECIQNSYHHTGKNDTKAQDSPFVVVSQTPTDFVVYTGNYVSHQEAEKLDEQLEIINNMSTEDLRKYYIKNLNKDELPTFGGAGLGLVDITRRAGNKIIYNFDEISDDSLLFSMQVKVKN